MHARLLIVLDFLTYIVKASRKYRTPAQRRAAYRVRKMAAYRASLIHRAWQAEQEERRSLDFTQY